MKPHPRRDGSTPSDGQRTSRLLWVPLVSIWVLISATFSAPGRNGSDSLDSLDSLALYKVGARGSALVLLAFAILALWKSSRRSMTKADVAPFGLFVLWSLISCVWSPLPAFSVGQAMTLATLFLLAVAVALIKTGSSDTSTVLKHLSIVLLVVCAGLLAVHAVHPDWSGLARVREGNSAVGLYHPTMAGGTASLGLVLVVGCWLIWPWQWPRLLLWPSLIVFPIVMFLASSRTALATAVGVLTLEAAFMGNRSVLRALTLTACIGGIVYPLLDPGLEAARLAMGSSVDYARRGESTETLMSLTGRTQLWDALRESFLDAPLMGHGYFVTSATGSLDVWSGPTNRSAHNLMLQVAVTTGTIGLVLFVRGLWRLVVSGWRRLGPTANGRRLRQTAAVLACWYLGWGALNESFMGPLSPEAVLAFTLLGLITGVDEPEAA